MFVKSVIIGMLFAGSSAFADVDQHQTITNVSLNDLQAKCADLQANPQIKPIKVTVSCNELSYFWKAGPAQQAQLPNQRSVGAMVQMKGFQVPHEFFTQDVAPTAISCQTFVKYEHKVQNVDVELSCADLAAVTDLGAYCAPIVGQRVQDDAGLGTDTPTNETISLCPNNSSASLQH